ncbi:hypothetical protein GOP47_0012191 [Adiantum capillus-veneris]|uniref:Uncharacterized protein n=1 Tax=Adiantum capillus-veneris TaxID=13818 RepID=A0A9D4ZGA0_ADICA|nr:hypothetical protein GOP47_0012191 [Adiantum capillus-veneris]
MVTSSASLRMLSTKGARSLWNSGNVNNMTKVRNTAAAVKLPMMPCMLLMRVPILFAMDTAASRISTMWNSNARSA